MANIQLPHSRFALIDCRDEGEVDRFVAKAKPDVIYHLAANAAENKAQFSPIDITSRNYDAFIKVLTAGIRRKVKKIVFVSSIAVYGAGQTPFKETDTPHPEDLYGISKLAAEESLKVMAKVHGFEYMIVRPHNVFGERQNMADPYRNVVTIFMNNLLRGEPCVLYAEGQMIRQFTYISTVVKGLEECLNHKNLTVNLGNPKALRVAELLEMIEGVSGKTTKKIMRPARPQEVLEAVADHDYQWKFMGITTNLDDTTEQLRRTWKWCEAQGPQEPKYDTLEIISPKSPWK